MGDDWVDSIKKGKPLMVKGTQLNHRGEIYFALAVTILLFTFGVVTYVRRNHMLEEFSGLLTSNETIVDYEKNNNTIYAIISSESHSEYGDLFVVLTKNQEGKWARSYENDFIDLKPWMLQLADVDGDGEKEIITAVRKTTHYDKTEKNRLFVFNYSDGLLIKKWTGSEIAGTWNFFLAKDILTIPGSELIFIEETEDKKEKISIYYWFDFGFLKLADSKPYDDIIDLTVLRENRIQITWRNDHEHRTVVMVKDGEITDIK